MSSPDYSPRDPSSGDLPPGLAGGFILLLCAVVPFIMIAITYEVIARHFFNAVPLWVNDVTGYLQLAVTLLGGAYVMAREGHTRVDIVVEHSSVGIQRRLRWVNAVLVLLVCIVLACASGYTVWDAYQRKLGGVGIIEVPKYVILSPIFVGTVLLCIERVRYLRALIRGLRTVP
jgi:TRAP-type C4-dicarboxylate transport system permease small subunit